MEMRSSEKEMEKERKKSWDDADKWALSSACMTNVNVITAGV